MQRCKRNLQWYFCITLFWRRVKFHYQIALVWPYSSCVCSFSSALGTPQAGRCGATKYGYWQNKVKRCTVVVLVMCYMHRTTQANFLSVLLLYVLAANRLNVWIAAAGGPAVPHLLYWCCRRRSLFLSDRGQADVCNNSKEDSNDLYSSLLVQFLRPAVKVQKFPFV